MTVALTATAHSLEGKAIKWFFKMATWYLGQYVCGSIRLHCCTKHEGLLTASCLELRNFHGHHLLHTESQDSATDNIYGLSSLEAVHLHKLHSLHSSTTGFPTSDRMLNIQYWTQALAEKHAREWFEYVCRSLQGASKGSWAFSAKPGRSFVLSSMVLCMFLIKGKNKKPHLPISEKTELPLTFEVKLLLIQLELRN